MILRAAPFFEERDGWTALHTPSFLTWLDVCVRPTDVSTLVPFLKAMDFHPGFRYKEVVADAGYESEEDVYICSNGRKLATGSEKKKRRRNG